MKFQQATQEEFENKVKLRNPTLEVIGKYKGSKNTVKVKCRKCGFQFECRADILCREKKICSNCEDLRVNSHEKFISKMKEVDPNIEILSEYNGSINLIKCRCKVCGYEFYKSANALLRGHTCSKCSHRLVVTEEEFKERIKETRKNIEILSEYQGYQKPLLVRCKECNYEYWTTPLVLERNNCTKCGRKSTANKLKRSFEDIKKELEEKQSNIELISTEYINNKIPLKVRCKDCGHEWETTANMLLSARKGCPVCKSSKGEKRIKQWLEKNDIIYIRECKFNDCKDKNPLPFDFYLPDFKVAIEFDGEQHFRPVTYGSNDKEEIYRKFVTTKFHDKIKEGYCIFHDIKLIRISYKEIKFIEEILEEKVR